LSIETLTITKTFREVLNNRYNAAIPLLHIGIWGNCDEGPYAIAIPLPTTAIVVVFSIFVIAVIDYIAEVSVFFMLFPLMVKLKISHELHRTYF
jgi:hypothetical protein